MLRDFVNFIFSILFMACFSCSLVMPYTSYCLTTFVRYPYFPPAFFNYNIESSLFDNCPLSPFVCSHSRGAHTCLSCCLFCWCCWSHDDGRGERQANSQEEPRQPRAQMTSNLDNVLPQTTMTMMLYDEASNKK
jgi:hypothetical protein